MGRTPEMFSLERTIRSKSSKRKLFKKARCVPETKRKDHFKEIEPFPAHAQQFPVNRVNWYYLKSWVHFGVWYTCTLPKGEEKLNGIVNHHDIISQGIILSQMWEIVCPFSECFLGTRHSGEIWKFNQSGRKEWANWITNLSFSELKLGTVGKAGFSLSGGNR